jgi:vacuolar-type H+-ATPase subunit E/Vma4
MTKKLQPVVSHDVDVWISSVLNERQGQVVDVVKVARHPRVLDHVQQRKKNVRRTLTEPDVGIEAVLKEKCQEIANELESGRLVLVSGQRNVFSGSKVEDVQRGQVAPGGAVRIRAILA